MILKCILLFHSSYFNFRLQFKYGTFIDEFCDGPFPLFRFQQKFNAFSINFPFSSKSFCHCQVCRRTEGNNRKKEKKNNENIYIWKWRCLVILSAFLFDINFSFHSLFICFRIYLRAWHERTWAFYFVN